MIKTSLASLAAVVTLVACKTSGSPAVNPSSANPAAAPMQVVVPETFSSATAILHDASGKQVGRVTFADSYAGVVVDGTVNDLGLGSHGIHIHAIGKCEPPFTTAGGHFNPGQRQHGYLNQHGPHLGDLPNLDTPASSSLHFEALLPNVTLKGQNALLDADGSAVVVHAGRDDYKTDPAGNSGGRVACGVITAN
ncbi:MAG TPA: superoxide dismutase family protein [Gemmatimonadaceae bacterium]|nr:superoxide dismutase family protein [Gemmatimonadaceae bacterium]